MTTTKVELDVYEDEDGTLYQRVPQRDGVKDPAAVREFFRRGDADGVRWLVPLGTRHGSKAERELLAVREMRAAQKQYFEAGRPLPVAPAL